MPSTYDRRAFLQRAGLAGAAGTALALGLPRPPALADEALVPFEHGVASGDPLDDRVILWTRVRPPADAGPVEVSWWVATDLAGQAIVASGVATASATRDWTVKVDAAGLAAGTSYYYGFEALGAPSLVGRTRTAPDGAVDRLRFAVASCSNYQGGFFNAYARIAERDDLDAVLHLGDYIYEYGNGPDRYGPGDGELAAPRDHEPDVEMVTLADYRARHALYKRDPDLRRVHQLHPFVVTWDDHESANNSRRDSAENHGDDDYGPEGEWLLRKAASRQAYEEWMPIRTEDPSRIYRALAYGDLCDIIVLDTRLEGRDDELGMLGATIISGAEIDDPARELISPEQRAFLLDRLSSSPARWHVIAQQVILGQWNGGGVPSLDLPDTPQFKLRDGGNALNPDQWDGYTAERARLFDHLVTNDIGNVVVLTGDVHTSWALDLTPDPYDPTIYVPPTGEGALGVEFVTPNVTSANFEGLGPAVAALEAGTLADNPHVKWVDFASHGYFVLDVTPERVQADWFAVDTVLEPSDGESFLAAWQTLDDARHVSPAEGPLPAGQAGPEAPPAEVAAPVDPSRQPFDGAGQGAPGAAGGTALPATGSPFGLGVPLVLGAGGAAALSLRRRADRSAGGSADL